MNPLDKQVEAVAAMLRKAGGRVGMEPDAPDFIKRAWLQSIMECPDCRAAMMGKGDGHAN